MIWDDFRHVYVRAVDICVWRFFYKDSLLQYASQFSVVTLTDLSNLIAELLV